MFLRPHPKKWLGALALASLTLLPALPARADSVTAEALFQSGREALDGGDFRLACERFEESYRLEPTAGTALNLGNCRERLGQLAAAWQRFREAAEKLPSGDSRVGVATARAAALESKIPKLTLRAPEGSEDWQILRDGSAVGPASLNLPLPLDPGSHLIEVRAPNRSPWREHIELEPSQHRELQLRAGVPLSVASDRHSLASPNEGSRRAWGYALGGVGVVGIAAGVVTGAMVMSKSATVEAECVEKRCSDKGLAAAESGRTLSTASTVAFAAGAAFVGVGIYLVLSGQRGEPQTASASRRETRIEATTSLGAAGFSVRTSF